MATGDNAGNEGGKWRRLMRGLVRAGLALLVVPIAFLGILYAFPDEGPTEAYGLLANAPVVETLPGNGFIAYVGSNAPADADAMDWGRQWIAAHQAAADKSARDAANHAFPLVALPFKGDAKSLCDPGKASCIEMAREQGRAWRELASSNAVIVQRQQALVDYPAFAEAYIAPHIESSVPHTAQHARRLALNLMALDAAEGRAVDALVALERRIAFDRRALDGARSILTGMVVVKWLTDDYAQLADLLAEYPQLGETHHAKLMSITEPISPSKVKEVCGHLFEGEGRWQVRALGSEVRAIANSAGIGSLWEAASGSESLRLVGAVSPFLLKPQASLNQIAAENLALRQRIQEYVPHRWKGWVERERYLSEAAAEESRSWKSLYNLTGKVMVNQAMPDFSTYLLRVTNLVGITHLARLQLELLKQDPAGHETALQTAAQNGLNDPYTVAPMAFDPQNRRIYFDSIRSAEKPETLRVYASLGRPGSGSTANSR